MQPVNLRSGHGISPQIEDRSRRCLTISRGKARRVSRGPAILTGLRDRLLVAERHRWIEPRGPCGWHVARTQADRNPDERDNHVNG
jgi:hypothetical protein